jgi:hypothetical protein
MIGQRSFDPCGMIVDLVRSCYRSQMLFDPNSNLTTPVVWYPCAAGAKPLPFPTAFCSSIWYTGAELLNTVLGEIPTTRKYARMQFGIPASEKPCGTPEQFLEGEPVPPPPPPPTEGPGGIVLGGEVGPQGKLDPYGRLACCGAANDFGNWAAPGALVLAGDCEPTFIPG